MKMKIRNEVPIKIILSSIGVVAIQHAFSFEQYLSNKYLILFNIVLFLIFILMFEKKEKVSIIQNRKEYVIDSNIIIDGRIFKLFKNKILDGKIIILDGVFMELQLLTDSNDTLKKNRSRNAFKTLNQLKDDKDLDLEIVSNGIPNGKKEKFLPTDQQILEYCLNRNSILITNDNGLNAAALAKNIKVINFKSQIVDILKVDVDVGEIIIVDLVRKGKTANQAIGYTDTNLMVVVNDGLDYIGQRMKVKVINTVETNAGELIFAGIYNSKSE